MARGPRLDFRKVFRRVGRAELDSLANAVAALARPVVGGRAGGSIVDAIRKMKPRIRAWGYVLPLSDLGQSFWWLLNGAIRRQSRQPGRPVPDRNAEFAATLSEELARSAAEQLSAFDRSVAA